MEMARVSMWLRLTSQATLGIPTYPPRMRIVLQKRLAQVPVVKVVDVRVLGDERVRVVGPGAEGRVAVHVASEAARVRAQSVGAGVAWDPVDDGRSRTKTDHHTVEHDSLG